jgi:hypothetical protein
MVAETVLDSAIVEESVPVATPLALVVPTGWVRVLPNPVAERTAVAPGIGLPKASLAMTVIVELLDPLLAVMPVGKALTVDCEADTPPTVMLNAFEDPAFSPTADAVKR